MHFLVKASIPTEVGNAKVKNGTLPDAVKAVLTYAEAKAKPETIFFTAEDGVRTVYALMNVTDTTGISLIEEAWYLAFKAKVDIQLACTPEDAAMAAPMLPALVAKFG